MDATLKVEAEKLDHEMATQATTIDDLNGLLRTMMKSAPNACSTTRWTSTSDDELCQLQLRHTSRPVTPSLCPPPAKLRAFAKIVTTESPKALSVEMADIALQTPRDRKGTFEPQLIAKHQLLWLR